MRFLAAFVLTAFVARAQVYSPVVVRKGQVDTSSLASTVKGIYDQADAQSPRAKAEAIWRFFLTDGRFVKPGFFYHIAGWAYEEPRGEVLDPIKLLNSYGYGLCYHVAPLLEAVFEAGGFSDARVWFLTGHTVAEVYYDGAYHYFDSDMMGYNTVGAGTVASVEQIERDGKIITGTNPAKATAPWYPADVRANAIDGLAELFTTSTDNWLFPFKRYSSGHTMDFVLRPGERMIRYFQPASEQRYYLPFAYDGTAWREFPQEIAQYNIRTADGPKSQKDGRAWSTGRIEYRPKTPAGASFTIAMPSPYVIIDAAFSMDLKVRPADRLTVETSVDGGHFWSPAGVIAGPFAGAWKSKPAVLAKGAHGELSAVAGHYGYQVRVTSKNAQVHNLLLATEFALNPRSLPELVPGRNEFQVRTGNHERSELPISAARFRDAAHSVTAVEYKSMDGQGWVQNTGTNPGTVIFELHGPLSGFDAGGRFLDLRDGLAPDKLTAEVRRVVPWPIGLPPAASLAWALHPGGPWKTLWSYDAKQPSRTLRWPEVDQQVRDLPADTRTVYVRYQMAGMAIDDFRLATVQAQPQSASTLMVTHQWKAGGHSHERTEKLSAAQGAYTIDIAPDATVQNIAIVMECPTQP